MSLFRRLEFNLFQHQRITALRLHNDAPAQFIILRTETEASEASSGDKLIERFDVEAKTDVDDDDDTKRFGVNS